MRLIRRLRTNKMAFMGALAILAIALMAIFASPLAPHDPNVMDTPNRFAPPGMGQYLLGTDEFGRDVLSRIIFGSRLSLLIAGSAVGLAAMLGGTVGILSGFLGGWFDTIVMRVVDLVFAIPALMIALSVVGILGPGATTVVIALAVAYSPTIARVSRGATVFVRAQGFVEASRAMGASNLRMLLQDIVPNILPLLMVQMTCSMAWGILDEAALGFLGMGVSPPTPSWGSMLTTGRQYFYSSPTLPLFAGLAVVIAVFGFNLLGDGLRDLLDPRAWQRGD